MRTIKINNPILDTYSTDLGVDYVSGLNIAIRNTATFAGNDILVFGNPGEELTEIGVINSIVPPLEFILFGALNFGHNKGTPLFKTLWSKISLEAQYTDSFAEITSAFIQWDNQENKTVLIDPNGTDDTNYRFRFLNHITGVYSEYSPTLLGTGFAKNQMGYIIRDARRIAGDKEGNILSTQECLRALTRAKNIIRAHNGQYWFWKVNGYQQSLIDATTIIPANATQSIYSLDPISDLGNIDLINFRYNQGGTDFVWAIKRKSDIEFLQWARNRNRPSFDFPHFFRLLPADQNSTKGYFEIEYAIKSDNVGSFYIDYYKEEPDYDSVSTSTSLVIPEILEDYLISEIYASKGNQAQADKYYSLFTGPQAKKKTENLQNLSGIALLDELDRQSKETQGQPKSLWRFRGQKAMSNLYGSRTVMSPDYIRENYFDGPE